MPLQGSQLTLRWIMAMLLLAVMWGLSIPVTKLGLETLPPLTLTALRFAIAVPALFLVARRRIRLPAAALPQTAALGVLGIGIGQVAQTFGIQGTTASVGTILSATIPLFIVIFAALRLKQIVTWPQRLGLVCAFAGMVLVASGHDGEGAVQARHGPAWRGCWFRRSPSPSTMSGAWNSRAITARWRWWPGARWPGFWRSCPLPAGK